MKRVFGGKNLKTSGESVVGESLRRGKSKWDLSFRTIWNYSIHKWMLAADFLSWVMLAVLMWGLEKTGRGRVRNMLRKLRPRRTHLV